MAVASFPSLPMTTLMSMRGPYPQKNTCHVAHNIQFKGICLSPLSIGCPLQLRAPAASSRSNGGRSYSKSKKLQKGEEDEDSSGEDALEALFGQLEEDLKQDELSDNDVDREISEEEVARFEEELSEVVSDGEADEDELPDYSTLKLKDWQLRKLAAALELGRRKASIKSLSAELGLDRVIVLELLRNPPPQLAFFQDSRAKTSSVKATRTLLSGKVESSESESKPLEYVSPSLVETEAQKNDSEVPTYVNQMGWNKKKRMKKVHIATLEKVYQRTRRPTETMVDNLTHLTKLPRGAILKWFEDRRSQETAKFVYKKQ